MRVLKDPGNSSAEIRLVGSGRWLYEERCDESTAIFVGGRRVFTRQLFTLEGEAVLVSYLPGEGALHGLQVDRVSLDPGRLEALNRGAWSSEGVLNLSFRSVRDGNLPVLVVAYTGWEHIGTTPPTRENNGVFAYDHEPSNRWRRTEYTEEVPIGPNTTIVVNGEVAMGPTSSDAIRRTGMEALVRSFSPDSAVVRYWWGAFSDAAHPDSVEINSARKETPHAARIKGL